MNQSSSSEEIQWERQLGGNEPTPKEQNPPENQHGHKRKKPKRKRGEAHKPQHADNYYHMKKMDSLDTIKRKQQQRKSSKELENNQNAKQKDQPPPVYPDFENLEIEAENEEGNPPISDNFMLYVILGYITGIVLVLLWYLVVFGDQETDLDTKWFIIVFLLLILFMIFFNHTTRCIAALLVPLLFGYRGRLLIMCWAFYLALTGPVANIVHNIEVMVRSLGCALGLLSNALTPMHQLMAEPVYIVEQSVYNCLNQVRKLTEPLDDVLQRLETPIVELFSAYRTCGEWLRHQQSFLDKQMGTPYDRCMGAGSISVQECRAKFTGDKSVCDIEKRFEWFCSNLKELQSFYDPQLEQHQKIAEQIFTRPLESLDKIRSSFEASITFDHAQRGSEQDAQNSSNDIDQEISQFLDFEMKLLKAPFTWLYIVIVVLFIIAFLKAIYFRVNFLGSVNYRNMFLTKEFYDYNNRQHEKLGYSALPLRSTETANFTKLFSFRYLPIEMDVIYNPLVFMLITSLQLFMICLLDLTLFWMLASISYHSHLAAELPPPEYIRIHVEGGGMIGFILRGLVQAFEPLSRNLFADVQHCLPLPGPPKYMRYWEIVVICLFAWLLMIFEPFVLRLRHLIMSCFYPENAELRAEYMYERLLRNREIFILAVRRKARASNLYVYENWFTKFDRKFDSFLHWLTCGYYGSYKSLKCIICYAKSTKTDCVECETPNCRGVYCQTCFIESNCHCILCNPPMVYGDYSTYSEVDDSSDDPDPQVFPYRPHRACGNPPVSERDKSV